MQIGHFMNFLNLKWSLFVYSILMQHVCIELKCKHLLKNTSKISIWISYFKIRPNSASCCNWQLASFYMQRFSLTIFWTIPCRFTADPLELQNNCTTITLANQVLTYKTCRKKIFIISTTFDSFFFLFSIMLLTKSYLFFLFLFFFVS